MTELDIKSRLRELNELLTQTDYKMIKCYEAFMAQEEMPYDFAALKTQRDEWRDEINVLQNTTPEPYNGPAIVWEIKENKTIDLTSKEQTSEWLIFAAMFNKQSLKDKTTNHSFFCSFLTESYTQNIALRRYLKR